MLARCPSCRNTFSAPSPGRQACPICGKELIVPAGPPPSELPPVGPSGTPWERRDELGAFTAWRETVAQALFEPGKLFAAARLDRNAAQLGFAVLTVSIFWAASQLLNSLLMRGMKQQMQEMLGRLADQGISLPPAARQLLEQQGSPGAALVSALLSPVLVLIVVYLNAGVTHLFALLLGQAKRGFPATFCACAYGLVPAILSIVPGCGSIVGLVWVVILTGIGLRETHGMSTGRATAAVLLPYVVLCCALCGLGALAGLVVGGAQ